MVDIESFAVGNVVSDHLQVDDAEEGAEHGITEGQIEAGVVEVFIFGEILVGNEKDGGAAAFDFADVGHHFTVQGLLGREGDAGHAFGNQ